MTLNPVALSRATLPCLPEGVCAPPFDVAQVRAGIVHLGLGGFARAHLARYTHDVIALDPSAARWGIVGAGLRAEDDALLKMLDQQDRLYTLIERQGEMQHATVIGVLAGTIAAAGGSARLLAALDDPAVRIVSLTVTEHGYHLDRATKSLDMADAAIQADLGRPHDPRTAPGILVEAFRRRREAGTCAFSAMSCDNIQHNGDVLRGVVLTLAAARDPALARWIDREATFPNTMVDRITPVPTRADSERLMRETGLVDGAVVTAEAFRQWVIENRFVGGRPDWDRAGAQFVEDVAPYEAMKLRLLNASHLAIASAGELAGFAFIDEVIGDALFRRYMQAMMDRETGPTLAPVPGVDLVAYKRELIARFGNPAIRDTTRRVNRDAALNYLLDPLRDRLATARPMPLLALAVAAWCRRLQGQDDEGAAIKIEHPLAGEMQARARTMGDDPAPILSMTALFGDLGEHERFVGEVQRWFRILAANGTRAALDAAAAEGLI